MTSPLVAALFSAQVDPRYSLPLFILQVALLFGIFYFLLIRPQAQQRRKHEERIRNVKRGDQVVTAGGVIGEVIHIREATKEGEAVKSLDDAITIKSGESRLVVERRAIAKVATQGE